MVEREETPKLPKPQAKITRIKDPRRVAELFHPREDLSEEFKEWLIEIMAKTGAVLEGHFKLTEND